jgi:hypothetical protein
MIRMDGCAPNAVSASGSVCGTAKSVSGKRAWSSVGESCLASTRGLATSCLGSEAIAAADADAGDGDGKGMGGIAWGFVAGADVVVLVLVCTHTCDLWWTV